MKTNIMKLILCLISLLLIACHDDVMDLNDDIALSLPEDQSHQAGDNKTDPQTSGETKDIDKTGDELINSLTQADIMWLQESLKIAGFYTAMDGALGPNTIEKLQGFKQAFGISDEKIYTEAVKSRLEQIRKDKLAPGLGSHLVLLNKHYYIPSDYVPVDLVEVDVNKNKYIELVKEVAAKTQAMFSQAKSEGLTIYLASGYRSYLYQEQIFSKRVKNKGFDEAQTVVAIPGQSEHQTGLTIDITNEAMNFTLNQTFDQHPEFDWMMDNCYKYGFILRYRKGKEAMTGYIYEPWHYRYIGDVNKAQYIMENALILEEYFEGELNE